MGDTDGMEQRANGKWYKKKVRTKETCSECDDEFWITIHTEEGLVDLVCPLCNGENDG